MSLYLGNNLIAPNQSNAANKSLSNLDATGQGVINGKVDLDGSNATFPHIVETYINGTSGYIVYSNKWCKQWGVQAGNGTYSHIQVNLLKAYANTDYMIYGNSIYWSSENNGWYTGNGVVGQGAMIDIIGTPSNQINKTTEHFYLPSCSSHTWITEGYLP